MKNIIVAIKGFLMGAANVVPGVSGGTIALITGIYSQIIDALNSLLDRSTWNDLLHGRFKAFWEDVNGTFVLWLAIGVILSIFSLAKLMEYVLHSFPIQTWAFFFGLIIASAVVMFRGIRGWGVREALFVILGAVIGVGVCKLTPTTTPDSLLFLFICGAIAVCTMILPGISGSFILVILGKYDYVMNAVSTLDIPVLIVFGLGCVVGLLAFAKFLHWLLGKWEKQTMLTLLGFILGSLVKVWPWSDKTAIAVSQGLDIPVAGVQGIDPGMLDLHVASAVIWCILGIAVVAGIELLAGKSEKKAD